MSLDATVLKELQRQSELPLRDRTNALEARINRAEAALASRVGDGAVTWDVLPKFLSDAIKHANEITIKPLVKRIEQLENGPELTYCDVWKSGVTYKKMSIVTHAGSLWLAKQTTASYPGGNAEPGAWKLVCKRGADGKDAR